MPVYLIADINVINRQRYEDYRLQMRRAFTAFGGKFLVRGGAAQVIAGTWEPTRFVMIEFPSRVKADAFLASKEYAQAQDYAANATMINMILVEGIDKGDDADDPSSQTWTNLRR